MRALRHELAAKERSVVDHQSLRFDPRFDAAALAHLHGVVRRRAPGEQARDLDVRRLDVSLDDASGFDHQLARERQRSAYATGDFELAFAANAAFNRDASFDSTRHGRGEGIANALFAHDLDTTGGLCAALGQLP
jgi:hypothetical protein